ncbi:hypothetical protein RZS08_04610, partial [Arthrospira platensis SPKY1]|nr:hypothetical protein [Arthrospira platensis SPKY1]
GFSLKQTFARRRQHRPCQTLQQAGGGAGLLPEQGHVQRGAGHQLDQFAARDQVLHQAERVHGPAHAGQAGGDEALRGGQAVAGQFDDPSTQVLHPGLLQAVLGVEHQAGGGGQAVGVHTLREETGHKSRAGRG